MIETVRCQIRKFTENDVDALARILANSSVMKYIEPPYSLEQTRQFLCTAGLSATPLVYALDLKETGQLIGQVIFHPYREDSYEIGWILDECCWGQGLADEITKTLIAYAKDEGIAQLMMECAPNQSISMHIAIKNGFCLVSQDGLNVYKLKLR